MKKSISQHLIAIGIFLIVALIYSYPALQGNKLSAGDTVHWMGMSEEARSWYEKTGENPMWSNSMFGGMPTVTHYMRGHTNLIFPIQEFISNTLPNPIPFFFIAMVSFYLLMMSWKVNRWMGIFGAIAFAFASYNLQIISAGHNTKMFSIAYMPLVLAGMHWIYNKKYLIGAGAALTGLALMISNGMYQIDYYLFIILLFMGVAYFVQAIKEGTIKQFIISSAIMLVVGLVSVGPSLDQLMLTREYTEQTMRGGNSELTIGQKEEKKDGGLNKDYAFQWSQAIGETFTLFVPNLYGGASRTDVGTGSTTYEVANGLFGEQAADQVSKNASTYWGPQPFLSGPVYFGAIIMFLFVLGMFIIRSNMKWFMLGIGVLGIMMSWGNHFSGLNYFLFDHLPMYNKFRTPSMSMVIPGLMFCLLAIWAMNEYFSEKFESEKLLDYVKKSVMITGGLCVLLGIGSRFFMDFKGPNDDKLKAQMVQMTGGNEQAGTSIYNAIVEDRPSLAMKDGLRSLFFILLAAAALWMFAKKKLDAKIAIIAVGLLMAVDLLTIGMRYLNSDNYMPAEEFEAQFSPRPVDMQVKQDTDPYYRVFDLTRDPYNDAMGAYHHKLVGGYHPAKMERYQDLISNQLSDGKANVQVLNMLNTKYIIFNGQQNQPAMMPNAEACGNAWFVNNVKVVENADQEMLSMNAENLGDTAKVVNAFRPKETAIVQKKNWKQTVTSFIKDSSSNVKLIKYGLNDLSFESNNSKDGFVVFADIYYPLGWKAYVDDKETEIVKTNYILRGLYLTAGKHKIDFKFHPDTYFKWNMPSLISSILILLVLVGGIGLGIKEEMSKKEA